MCEQGRPSPLSYQKWSLPCLHHGHVQSCAIHLVRMSVSDRLTFCHSVNTRRRPQRMLGYTLPGSRPPSRSRHPRGSRQPSKSRAPPPRSTTPGAHPSPGTDTPRPTRHPADGYCCGRYASYWNAFLLFLVSQPWFLNDIWPHSCSYNNNQYLFSFEFLHFFERWIMAFCFSFV